MALYFHPQAEHRRPERQGGHLALPPAEQISHLAMRGRAGSWKIWEVRRSNLGTENENQACVRCVTKQWVVAASISWPTPVSFQGEDDAADTESLTLLDFSYGPEGLQIDCIPVGSLGGW